MKIRPLSFLHRLFGPRRAPLSTERAQEILRRNAVYTEVTKAKPIKKWKYDGC